MADKVLFNGFQRRKIQRLIAQHGRSFTFSRLPKNAYGEPIKEAIPTEHALRGFFYTQNNQKGFWMINTNDETRVRYERYLTQFILVLYEDFVRAPILLDDEVTINGSMYRVTGHQDIQEANFAVNISLDLTVGANRET